MTLRQSLHVFLSQYNERRLATTERWELSVEDNLRYRLLLLLLLHINYLAGRHRKRLWCLELLILFILVIVVLLILAVLIVI